MATPDDRRYTDQHEWAQLQDGDGAAVVRVGITDHAQDALGDIVFVQLPEVGAEVGPGNPIGEVESTKSVSDVYSPVAGTVVEVNSELVDAPQRLNEDPYGAGWICVIEPAAGASLDALLDPAAYAELIRT
jgi:glycine cleavage system H protein